MGYILIRGGRILKGKHWVRANILVNEDSGKIVGIFKNRTIPNYFKSKIGTIVNARDRLVLPGRIDIHVHFREPGHEYKETFETGSAAAIAGGTTIIADMPNNDPPTNSVERFYKKLEIVSGRSYSDFMFYIGVPEDYSELQAIKNIKPRIAGVKIYYYNFHDSNLFKKIDPPSDLLYIFHAEDAEYMADEEIGCNTYDDFEAKRPEKAEVEAVKEIINLAYNGYKVHITHVSTWQSLELILSAKKRVNNRITFDVTPHHLIISKEEAEKMGGIAKCYPPLRNKLNKLALSRAFRMGLIDAIASDHAPHSIDEKKTNLCAAKPGIAVIQYVLPIMFTLYKKLHIKDPRILLKVLSENPSKILNLRKRGKIKIGYYADLVIFNHRKRWIIRPDENFSKNKETPFDGMVVRGYVEATFLRGQIVYRDGELIKKIGKYVEDN